MNFVRDMGHRVVYVEDGRIAALGSSTHIFQDQPPEGLKAFLKK